MGTTFYPGTLAVPDATATVGRFNVFGHSYVGVRTTDGTNFTPWWPADWPSASWCLPQQYGNRLATNTVNNQGIGGTQIMTQTTVNSGGYPFYIAQFINFATSGTYYAAAPALSPPLILCHGANDSSSYNQSFGFPPEAFFSRIRQAQTFVMTLNRATCIRTDTDASIAYSGGWTPQSGLTALTLNATNHFTATPGSFYTITLPANFAGGECTLYPLGRSNGGGATFTVTGTASACVGQTFVTDDVLGNTWTTFFQTPFRIQGLLPSDAGKTIIVTATTIRGDGDIQGYALSSTDPKAIAMIGFPRCVTNVAYPDAIAARQRLSDIQVALTFDNRVIYVDSDVAMNGGIGVGGPKNGVNFCSDGVHPSIQGCAVMANALQKAWGQVPISSLNGPFLT